MLNDLRIVEMSEGMAAQVAGLMLCELGADVLKIERPGGEPARGCFANAACAARDAGDEPIVRGRQRSRQRRRRRQRQCRRRR